MTSVARTSTGDPEGAREAAAVARAAAERCGGPTALAQACYADGLSREVTDPDAALASLRKSAEHAGSVGNRWLRAFARTEELSLLARRELPGAAAEVLSGFHEVVDTWFRGGDWANQWLSLRHLFGVFVALGDDEVAGLLHGAIQAAGATTALPFEPTDAARTTTLVECARARCGEASFDAAVARGRVMRDEEVVRHTLRHLENRAAPRRGALTTSRLPLRCADPPPGPLGSIRRLGRAHRAVPGDSSVAGSGEVHDVLRRPERGAPGPAEVGEGADHDVALLDHPGA